MTVRLTRAELDVIETIERRLRASDPALDRLLSRWPGRVRRLLWRPAPLVVLIAVLAVATGAAAVCAGAATPEASAAAVAGAVALVAAFRRLVRVAGR
ncbi:DUF3040 domain-containing protein [Kitasatospora sp. NPDC048365]|uniref:DUF3040 domain-containing protein n=1 Tax=Kitasatospora sp. NPDC048365 TaxID=3364050 RepID=UPI0037166B1B